MTGHTFQIVGDRLRFAGVSFGHGDSDPFLVARDGAWMVVRTPSTTEWKCLGRTGAVPATWMLCRTEPMNDYPGLFRVVETVCRERPGRFWRRCRDELIKDMHDARRGACVRAGGQ